MHRYILLAVDLALILLATLIALALRENFEIAESRFEAFLPYLGATAIMSIILVPIAGLNKSIWRFSSFPPLLGVPLLVGGGFRGAVGLSFFVNCPRGVAGCFAFFCKPS